MFGQVAALVASPIMATLGGWFGSKAAKMCFSNKTYEVIGLFAGEACVTTAIETLAAGSPYFVVIRLTNRLAVAATGTWLAMQNTPPEIQYNYKRKLLYNACISTGIGFGFGTGIEHFLKLQSIGSQLMGMAAKLTSEFASAFFAWGDANTKLDTLNILEKARNPTKEM